MWLEQLRTQNTATVVCVQETHWPTDSEFSHDHWHFIHSGCGSSEAGVSVLRSPRSLPLSRRCGLLL